MQSNSIQAMRRIALAAGIVAAVAAHAQQPQAPQAAPPAGATGSTAPVVRGDRNASITTQAQRNVPRSQRSDQSSRFRPADPGAGDQPDVLLDIPNLSVDEIKLEVQNLQAHVSLDARVANLVKITAGVDATIEKVSLDIKGVKATVLLIVRLDNVREIIDKTLTTLDKNPQLVERLLQSVDNTVGTVGGVANTALQPGGVVSQTVNTLGQTVSRTVDAAGNIVERTLDTTGKLVSSNTVGRVLDLPVVRETTNSTGQVLRTVRDSSGSLIELTLDRAGQVVNSRVVNQAGAAAAQGTGAATRSVPPAPAR